MFDYLNTPSNTNSESKEDQKNKLVYDYYNTKIYKNQYEKSIDNGGYVKAPFVHLKGISDPHLSYLPTQSNYATKNIYIMKKRHGFPGDHDGELIIEHTPVTNSVFSVYTCFLLKTKSGIGEETVIDKIMNKSFDPYLEVRLNDFAQLNKECLSNKEHSVFLFPSQILISNTFDQLKSDMQLFSPYKESEYTKIFISKGESKNSDSESVKEGLETMGLPTSQPTGQSTGATTGPPTSQPTSQSNTMDCVPINIDNKEMDTVEMMPISGANAKYRGENQFLSTIVHFFIFVIMFVFGGMVVPGMYNKVVESICGSESCETNNNANLQKLLNFTGSLLFYFLLFTIGFATIGISNRSSMITGFGVLFFVFIFISGYIVYANENMKKITAAKINIEYMNMISMPFQNLDKSIFEKGNTKLLLGIIIVIIGLIMTFFFTNSFDKKNKKKNRNIFGSMFGLVVVFGFIFIGLTSTLNIAG